MSLISRERLSEIRAWLSAPGKPLTWADLRAKLTTLAAAVVPQPWRWFCLRR